MTSRLIALAVALLTAGYPAVQDLPHHRLASLTASSFQDLEFLVPLLKDVQVVQLGENGHGMAEAFQIKARLARFLHERLGFTVLAFESSVYLGYQGDVQAGQASARSTLTSSTIGVWHTEEVLPLFEYMKGTRGGARPLRLAAFVEQNLAALQGALGRDAPVIARQAARSMAAYVRYQASTEMVEYAEIRDRTMADNVLAVANDLFPGQKVVVWAHTYHVSHANERIAPPQTIVPAEQFDAIVSIGTVSRPRFLN